MTGNSDQQPLTCLERGVLIGWACLITIISYYITFLFIVEYFWELIRDADLVYLFFSIIFLIVAVLTTAFTANGLMVRYGGFLIGSRGLVKFTIIILLINTALGVLIGSVWQFAPLLFFR